MQSRLGTTLLIASALLASEVTGAEPPARLPDLFDVPTIDAYLSAQVQQRGRVGLSVAIIKDGRIILAKGYGKRSLKDGRPVEADTIFAIGSVSKQFVCACLLLLGEDGKLSVKDPVAKYYPDLTRANDITLLDLMNHVSGYPDYYPLDFVDRRMQQAIAPDELLQQYAGGKLDFEPGTRYSYSNTGYILMGRVVEKVSGETLGAFLGRRIFKPLAMNRTFYELDATDSRLATGHTTFALSDPEPVGSEGKGWLGGAGGIYSTPTDLAKWNLALMNGKLLKPESYALMTSPRKLANGKVSDYGCGVSVKVQSSRQVIAHNGAVSGFNTWGAMIPSTRSAVIMTCNLDGGLGSLPSQIFSLLLKEPPNVPSIAGPAAVDAVKSVFAAFQKGKLNRQQFGDEFNHYLTDKMLAATAKRLERYGKPAKIEVLSSGERGGMEVTTTRLTFKNEELRTLMYRKPDGKIEQFFVYKE